MDRISNTAPLMLLSGRLRVFRRNGWRLGLAVGALAWALLPAAGHGQGEVVRVATAGEVERAFARVAAGAEIVLEPGRYGAVELTGRQFDVPVRVRGREPWSAEVKALRLRDVRGVVVRGLRVDAAGKPSGPHARPQNAAVEMVRARRVRLSRNQIAGTPDGNFENDRMGLFVARSEDITVERNEIHNVLIGARFRETERLEVVRNSISDVAKDGLNFVGVRDTCIANNWVFATHPDEVAHTDFIQFWNKNSSVPTANVTIRGNILFQNNVHSTQAILIGDAPPDGYARFTIDNNVIYTSAFHGITASGLRDSFIRNNTVVTFPGLQWRAHISADGRDVVVADNVLTGLRLQSNGVTAAGNMTVQNRDPNAQNHYDQVFADAFARARVDPTAFLPPADLSTAHAAESGGLAHLKAMLSGDVPAGCEAP